MRRAIGSPASLSIGLVLLVLAAGPAWAAVTVYTSLAAFQAAAPGTRLFVDFEDKATGRTLTFTLHGLTFSSPLNNLAIMGPTAPGSNTVPPPPSRMLGGDGHEDIFATSAIPSDAWGFTLLTNQYGPGTLTLYDSQGNAFFTHQPAQPPNTLGFLGVVSDTPILKIHWLADRGSLQNTGLDNFYLVDPSLPARGTTWSRVKSMFH